MDFCKAISLLPREEQPENGSLAELCRWTEAQPLFQALLAAVDGYLLILDPWRRVLVVNSPLQALPGGRGLEGDRFPGEVLGCVHASDGAMGRCGGGRACAACGVSAIIRASQLTQRPATGECLATVRRGAETVTLALRVRVTPFRVEARDFTAVVLRDLGAGPECEALDHDFYHDALELANLLVSWSGLLNGCASLDPPEAGERIRNLAWRLKQEIETRGRLSQFADGAPPSHEEESAASRGGEAPRK